MLIKPISIRAPRHIFDEEEDSPAPIPEITIQLGPSTKYDHVLIIPKTVSILNDSFANAKKVGTISITYPKKESPVETDEYDEDEQLYHAVQKKSAATKYPDEEIAITSFGSFIGITIPHFTNTIVYNILSSDLVKQLSPGDSWVTVAPCSLNNNQTVNKLLVNPKVKVPTLLNSVPDLKPPHTITGITGAVTSKLNLLENPQVVGLVLNSEGQPGFEKSDNDAIVDAAYVISELVNHSAIEKEDYVKKVSSTVRKFNGFSNSGMYI